MNSNVHNNTAVCRLTSLTVIPAHFRVWILRTSCSKRSVGIIMTSCQTTCSGTRHTYSAVLSYHQCTGTHSHDWPRGGQTVLGELGSSGSTLDHIYRVASASLQGVGVPLHPHLSGRPSRSLRYQVSSCPFLCQSDPRHPSPHLPRHCPPLHPHPPSWRTLIQGCLQSMKTMSFVNRFTESQWDLWAELTNSLLWGLEQNLYMQV